MENRVPALDGERVFRARKKAVDHLRDCKIKVLSYWTVEMHNRSEIEFHILHQASVYWRQRHKPSLSQYLVYKIGPFVDGAPRTHERIKGANRDKCRSHGAYPFSCI